MYVYDPRQNCKGGYPKRSPIGMAITSILKENAYRPITDPAKALAVIEGAAGGNTPDVIRALHAVGGPIRRLRRKAQTLPREDFDSAVTLALAEALRDFDPDSDTPSFANIGKQVYRRGLNSVVESRARAVAVPRATLSRYFKIVRAARERVGDDAEDYTFAALELAREFHMRVDTFMAVRDAVSTVPYSHMLTPEQEAEGVRAEDVLERASLKVAPEASESAAELADLAMSVLNPEEAEVVATAYGLAQSYPLGKADYNERSDAEVGARMGLSRSRVQQIRTGALVKMRAALLGE